MSHFIKINFQIKFTQKIDKYAFRTPEPCLLGCFLFVNIY